MSLDDLDKRSISLRSVRTVGAEEEIAAVWRESQAPEAVVVPSGFQSFHPTGLTAPD